MRRTIALFAIIAACWISTPSQSAEISGAWKIDTRGGPVPLCSLVQVGNNLNGSCVGPKATGTVRGTVVGQTVRWRWQWVTYAGNSAAAFDFIGTLGLDNTITGMVERRETGLSLSFTAKRQSTAFQGLPDQSLQLPYQQGLTPGQSLRLPYQQGLTPGQSLRLPYQQGPTPGTIFNYPSGSRYRVEADGKLPPSIREISSRCIRIYPMQTALDFILNLIRTMLP